VDKLNLPMEHPKDDKMECCYKWKFWVFQGFFIRLSHPTWNALLSYANKSNNLYIYIYIYIYFFYFIFIFYFFFPINFWFLIRGKMQSVVEFEEIRSGIFVTDSHEGKWMTLVMIINTCGFDFLIFIFYVLFNR